MNYDSSDIEYVQIRKRLYFDHTRKDYNDVNAWDSNVYNILFLRFESVVLRILFDCCWQYEISRGEA